MIELLNKIQGMDNRLQALEKEVKVLKSNKPKPNNRAAQEAAVVGKPAPSSWKITKWFQGEDQTKLDNTKTTLLVFWDVWCPHCRREVPKIENIHNKLKDKGLQVLGLTKVNRSATDEKIEAFIKDNNLTYPIAKEDGSLSQYFAVRGVPAAAVVKGDKVVWRGHPVRLTLKMLEDWL